MTTKQAVTPLTINTKSFADPKSDLYTARFHYDEPVRSRRPSAANSRAGSRRPSHDVPSPRRQRQNSNMSAHQNGSSAVPQAMFVRAQYDYESDDRTSLSFRQGDLIQVINQLESGWWDGILSGVRGWFPSNYCAIIPNDPSYYDASQSTDEGESGDDEEIETAPNVAASQEHHTNGIPHHATDADQEEASAYWVPQATSDGRLFYYNTLTRVSTMELPLQTPTTLHDTGPRNRITYNVNETTRPPPELLMSGTEHEEDDASASEAEEAVIRAQRMRRRRSQLSDGVSPAPSMESLDASPGSRARNGSRDFYRPKHTHGTMSVPGVTVPGFTGSLLRQYPSSNVPRSFFDDGSTQPLTWNRLVENMRRSVESYRQAISNCDRTEYVRRAEDISDHLRMLLAAGSGTTDNHSGNPSIISTNKALYPHFRDMMSRFSKLVLSSHIAAADWPAPDAYSKCLQEAEGVLHGVYGYVEIARAQRGEEIPRLIPGFVLSNPTGGNWRDNSVGSREPLGSSFMDQDDLENTTELNTSLDVNALKQMDERKRAVLASIRRLEENLVAGDKVISPSRHEQISTAICTAAIKVVENLRPCIALVESLNLACLGCTNQTPQLVDFVAHKQRLYDLSGALVVACQTVAGPLGDEWAENRGEPLEERLKEVRSITKQIESSVSQMGYCVQTLLSKKPQDKSSRSGTPPRKGSRDEYGTRHGRNQSRNIRAAAPGSPRGPYGDPFENPNNTAQNISKISQFFGVPVQEETPEYLRLEHEGELAWDTKADPPQLRGGTLTALVEQLTRHDRLDTSFNNTFLLTYRSFTTASELFEMLVKRFTIQPPRGISQDNYRTWVEKKQKPIRFRVVNILKSWFDSYWMEGRDEASMDLLRRVHAFAKESIATSTTPGSGPLITVIDQRLKGHDLSRRMVPNLNGQAPTPIVPKNMKKLRFMDIDPTEFARQLTLIEYSLYGKIKATECLNKTWQKKVGPEEEDPAPNVKALILHSNQLTNWVAEAILAQNDARKRATVIKHFVGVADKCRQLNNFSALTSIISALGTAPIHRLNRTWTQVNARTSSTLETMRRLMASNKNFGEYRETLHSVNPPCIPFLGTYLTDLTFIDEGIPSIIKKTDLINFSKWSKTAEVIRDIQQYQNVPYPLTAVRELQEYILTNMQNAGDVHEMYDRSLQVEPREREDEKIARLLSESGFL